MLTLITIVTKKITTKASKKSPRVSENYTLYEYP